MQVIQEKYKTFWRRLWSLWIDGIIFLPFSIISHFIWKDYKNISVYLIMLWYTFFSISGITYSIFMHGKYGQTLGKMIFRIRVLDISENILTMSQAIQRDIVLIFLGLIDLALSLPRIATGVNIQDVKNLSFEIIMTLYALWFIAEPITMLSNEKRRSISDFIAKSVVVTIVKNTSVSTLD